MKVADRSIAPDTRAGSAWAAWERAALAENLAAGATLDEMADFLRRPLPGVGRMYQRLLRGEATVPPHAADALAKLRQTYGQVADLDPADPAGGRREKTLEADVQAALSSLRESMEVTRIAMRAEHARIRRHLQSIEAVVCLGLAAEIVAGRVSLADAKRFVGQPLPLAVKRGLALAGDALLRDGVPAEADRHRARAAAETEAAAAEDAHRAREAREACKAAGAEADADAENSPPADSSPAAEAQPAPPADDPRPLCRFGPGGDYCRDYCP